MKKQSISLAVLILFFISNSIFATTASFQGLGYLPGSGDSFANAVSADGSVVVGGSGGEAFRWESGVMVGLGFSLATGVSSDGSVVVGFSGLLPKQAFRWTQETGRVGLGDLPGGDFYSVATGVSTDGSIVVGGGKSADSNDWYEAFRWENGVMTGLGDLPGGIFNSHAFGISSDGSVIVGYSSSASGPEAFRWENGTMIGIGDLPGRYFSSVAYCVSSDGSVIVGYGYSASGREAFRWENGQMVGLGGLSVNFNESRAWDCSADGSVVVGYSKSPLAYEAFIWDKDNGMRNLKDILMNDFGLDLAGWELFEAVGISGDGLTIVGYGYNPDGYREGWIATIPEPATILLLALGGLVLRRKTKVHKV